MNAAILLQINATKSEIAAVKRRIARHQSPLDALFDEYERLVDRLTELRTIANKRGAVSI